jgi:hypothetical protein
MSLLTFTTTKMVDFQFTYFTIPTSKFTTFTKTQSKKIVIYHIYQIQKVADQKFTILTKPIFGECGKTSK